MAFSISSMKFSGTKQPIFLASQTPFTLPEGTVALSIFPLYPDFHHFYTFHKEGCCQHIYVIYRCVCVIVDVSKWFENILLWSTDQSFLFTKLVTRRDSCIFQLSFTVRNIIHFWTLDIKYKTFHHKIKLFFLVCRL